MRKTTRINKKKEVHHDYIMVDEIYTKVTKFIDSLEKNYSSKSDYDYTIKYNFTLDKVLKIKK